MNRAMLSQISRHFDDSRQTLEKALRDLSTTIEESQIYIGLNDSETKQQKLATDRYAAILKEVCKDSGSRSPSMSLTAAISTTTGNILKKNRSCSLSLICRRKRG